MTEVNTEMPGLPGAAKETLQFGDISLVRYHDLDRAKAAEPFIATVLQDDHNQAPYPETWFSTSPLNDSPKYTEQLYECLGIVCIGTARDGTPISRILHCQPGILAHKSDSPVHRTNNQEFSVIFPLELQEFRDMTKKEGRFVGLTGGMGAAIQLEGTTVQEQNEQMTKLLTKLIQANTDVAPHRLTPPKTGLGGSFVYVDTPHKKIVVVETGEDELKEVPVPTSTTPSGGEEIW